MKKLLLLALTSLLGLVAWRKVSADRAGQQLWAEATDPVTTPGA